MIEIVVVVTETVRAVVRRFVTEIGRDVVALVVRFVEVELVVVVVVLGLVGAGLTIGKSLI